MPVTTTELLAIADAIESEADIAARPGQFDRLRALAARLRHQATADETPPSR